MTGIIGWAAGCVFKRLYAAASLVERVKDRSDRAPQRCSMPCFLTLAFLILSGSHAGPPAGLSTIEIEPVKTCTRLVPRSRRRMFVCPRVAALRAAPRGCLLANTWLVSLPFSMRTKYFLSDIWGFLQILIRTHSYYIFRRKKAILLNILPSVPLSKRCFWTKWATECPKIQPLRASSYQVRLGFDELTQQLLLQ